MQELAGRCRCVVAVTSGPRDIDLGLSPARREKELAAREREKSTDRGRRLAPERAHFAAPLLTFLIEDKNIMPQLLKSHAGSNYAVK